MTIVADEDTKPQRRLAQASDAMFERNLSILAARGKELAIATTTPETFIGYASGLDEEYLQMCLSEDQSLVLINREYIVRVSETGETLEGVGQTDAAKRERIRDRVCAFMNVAGHHSGRR
jgi:hypothetical protein